MTCNKLTVSSHQLVIHTDIWCYLGQDLSEPQRWSFNTGGRHVDVLDIITYRHTSSSVMCVGASQWIMAAPVKARLVLLTVTVVSKKNNYYTPTPEAQHHGALRPEGSAVCRTRMIQDYQHAQHRTKELIMCWFWVRPTLISTLHWSHHPLRHKLMVHKWCYWKCIFNRSWLHTSTRFERVVDVPVYPLQWFKLGMLMINH